MFEWMGGRKRIKTYDKMGRGYLEKQKQEVMENHDHLLSEWTLHAQEEMASNDNVFSYMVKILNSVYFESTFSSKIVKANEQKIQTIKADKIKFVKQVIP